jgi:hypothetical protein
MTPVNEQIQVLKINAEILPQKRRAARVCGALFHKAF